jgi:hypothetical protein
MLAPPPTLAPPPAAVNNGPCGRQPPSIPRSLSAASRPSKRQSSQRRSTWARCSSGSGWRPAGQQPAATQFIDGQGLPLAHQPGAKAVQVSKAGPRRMTAPGPGDQGKTGLQVSLPHHRQLGTQSLHASQPPALPLTINPLENARSAARPGVGAVRCIGADHPSRPTSCTHAGPRRTAVILSLFARVPGGEGFLRGRHVADVRFWA